MEREIKFKVWDIFKKVFIPSEVFAVTTSNFSYFAIMIQDWEDYKAGEYMYPNTQSLSEFTGLQDKNGKDIYEGDIIVAANGQVSELKFGEWKYDFGGEYSCLWTGIGFHWANGEPFGSCHLGDGSLYEVIGNIYETPELIK